MKSIRHSKCSRIYKILKEEILSGKYKVDDLFYSETELIKRFEVSRPTTIRVLKDLQNEKLLIRRAGSGTYVSAPPQEKSGVFGVMMAAGDSSQNLHPMITQLLNSTRKINKSLIIGNDGWKSLGHLPEEEQLLNIFQPFQQSKIEGLFFVPFYDIHRHTESNTYELLLNPLNQVFLNHLRSLNIPVVLLDYGMGRFPTHSNYDLITTDHFLGGYLQGQHLLQKTTKSVHFVCAEAQEHIPSIEARREGLRFALQEKGLTMIVRKIDPQNIDQVKKLLDDEKPENIVASNDVFAAKMMNTLYQLQVSIPDQIRIIGFDDNPVSKFSIVPITTIQQPFAEIAEVATKTLLDRVAGVTTPPASILLKPQIVIRESCP